MNTKKIISINPGSTTTKVAMFESGADGTMVELFSEEIEHPAEELRPFETCIDQREVRLSRIFDSLKNHGVSLEEIDAASGRGGPLRPIPGGTYRVNEALVIEILHGAVIDHPSLLGALLARSLVEPHGKPSFIVDPVSVDEYEPLSRISGLKETPRKSLGHFLNKRAVAHRYSNKVGKKYEELNLIVVHMGGGISMSAHKRGRIIDSSDSNGEGPFSPERSGGIRVDDLAKLAFGENMTLKKLKNKLTREAGLMSHLGTYDAREVEKLIDSGNGEARLVYEALAYQVAKSTAALAVALSGEVDAILITGGLARSKMLVSWLGERLGWIAKIEVFPGEYEMLALAEGALRVLEKKELARVFPSCEYENGNVK